MCGNCSDPFHGISDDLDDAADFSVTPTGDDLEAGRKLAEAEAARYVEKCGSCRGTGRFTSYSGRSVGQCFKCNGTGKLSFKTSPDERSAHAALRSKRVDQKRIDLQDARKAWIDANPEDFAWLNAKQESFEFARSVYDSLMKYGKLSEKQHAVVTKMRLADVDRVAQRRADDAARIANAPVVNVARIEQAFAHAMDKGIKRPKMRLGEYRFSLAPATGANAGALYVTRPADDLYLGKIKDGVFMAVRRACSVEMEAEIVALASDPHASSIAYGQRTGVCGICGRELTNHASIDLGIGPICAEKYGWA